MKKTRILLLFMLAMVLMVGQPVLAANQEAADPAAPTEPTDTVEPAAPADDVEPAEGDTIIEQNITAEPAEGDTIIEGDTIVEEGVTEATTGETIFGINRTLALIIGALIILALLFALTRGRRSRVEVNNYNDERDNLDNRRDRDIDDIDRRRDRNLDDIERRRDDDPRV